MSYLTREMPDIQVNLVETAEDVGTFIDWLDEQLRNRETLAIDTETSGLHWWSYNFTRLWQVGTATEGYAVPVNWWGKVIEAAMHKIVDSRVDVVFQNASFDMHAMKQAGWPLPDWSHVHDTYFLLHLYRSDLQLGLKAYKGATTELLGPWVRAGSQALKRRAKEMGFKVSGKDQDYWARMPVDEPLYWGYGVIDTCITRIVWDALANVRSSYASAYDRERRYAQIMFRTEERGIRLDVPYTEQLQVQLKQTMKDELHFLQANGLANPNSSQQVYALFEADFEFIPWEFTDNGNPSMNKHVLAALAKAGGLQEDVVVSLIKYKRASKWLSTYADAFLELVDWDGFVHPSMNTMGARTGRSTVRMPALQTLPSRDPLIRRCMLPPKGTFWYSMDYSNQEPRTLAYYSQSPALTEYFTKGDGSGSIHDFVAERMFGPSYTKLQRDAAKVFGLSRSYGAGPPTMAAASGMPVDEVKRIIPAYDEIVGLTALNDSVNRLMADRSPPYIITGGGRRSYVDEGKEYCGVNYLCQGTGADGMKEAVILLDEAGLADHLLLTMHDEGCFALSKDEAHLAPEIAKLMEQGMESILPGEIKFPVGIEGPGTSWGALYE